MKRCPQCYRVESDEALKFCRVDGAPLVNDSLDDEAGTVKLGSGNIASETATGVLPQTTDANMNRATAATTVLPAQLTSNTTSELTKPTQRRNTIIVAVVVLAAIVTVTVFFVASYRARNSVTAIQSIAVMPFVNESGNADVDYLSDGMTETLIKSLSLLPDLAVKSRSTVFSYKGKPTTPQNIGKELNVQAIVLGRLVGRGDQLHLALELVDTQNENIIWTDDYDRKPSDLLALQNVIAHDVSSKLRPKLSGADQAKVAKNYTTDSEAYRLYLQGRYYMNKRVGKLYDQGEAYFKQAIDRDPNFALGYAALAEYFSERDRPKAKENILRALALDNDLSDAHSTLGYQLMLDFDFAGAEREFKRAIELDPINFRAYQWNGWRLMVLGRYDESLASFDRAIAIEPTLADIRNNRAACLAAEGKIDEAIAENKKTIQIDPDFAWGHSHISFLYRLKGDHAASVEERTRAFELLDQPADAKRLRETFAASGWTAYLRELVRSDWGKLGNSETRRASLLSELGEKEEALAQLNTAAEKGDSWLFSIRYDPAFDPLRGDPRFQELLKKFTVPK